MNDGNEIPYFEDGTTRVLRYLRTNLGTKFKAFMEGDPIAIPTSLMPCICVVKLSGSTQPSATGTNDISESILIKVVYNKADDFGSEESLPNVALTERKLRHIVCGRDPATAAFLPESIFGILATNITLGNQILRMDVKDEYGINIRPVSSAASPEEDTTTSEAYITVDLTMRVIVIPRS